jgi:hypothetical protein
MSARPRASHTIATHAWRFNGEGDDANAQTQPHQQIIEMHGNLLVLLPDLKQIQLMLTVS